MDRCADPTTAVPKCGAFYHVRCGGDRRSLRWRSLGSSLQSPASASAGTWTEPPKTGADGIWPAPARRRCGWIVLGIAIAFARWGVDVLKVEIAAVHDALAERTGGVQALVHKPRLDALGVEGVVAGQLQRPRASVALPWLRLEFAQADGADLLIRCV